MIDNTRFLSSVVDDDDASYDNYTETTIDPGNSLFIIAIFICVGSVVALPLSVKVGKFIARWNLGWGNTFNNNNNNEIHGDENNDGQQHEDESALFPSFTGNHNHHHQPSSQSHDAGLSFIQQCQKSGNWALQFLPWRRHGLHTDHNTIETRRAMVKKGLTKEAQMSAIFHQPLDEAIDQNHEGDVEFVQNHNGQTNGTRIKNEAQDPGLSIDSDDDSQELDVYSHDEHSITQIYHWGPLQESLLVMWSILKYDYETKRILRLTIPFTFSALADTGSDLIIVAIISQNLGTDDMVAYAMVDLIVGVSSSFMGGWIEAVASLGSMAYGAENYELAGQYVQSACICFTLCELPMALLWGSTIGKILLLMGFGESVADSASSFVWVCAAIRIMKGLNDCIVSFLGVIEREKYANIMFCISSFSRVGFVALFATKADASLVVLGLVILVDQSLLFFLNILIPTQMGWYELFEAGLLSRRFKKNWPVVKDLFRVAFPLAVGSLWAYAEWEILTIFAAFLGPAEAATWAVLGYVWGMFESTTEAVGDASEVRVAYQLGKGRHALANLAAFKAMFIAFIMSVLMSIVFLSLQNILPQWLTDDTTLQSMLSELFPLVALGNVSMTTGMVGWAVVGAQGRYHLATSIATVCSLLITLPLSAVITIHMRIDLQGLTFAVVVGYTVTAMVMITCILISDWETLSLKIQDHMAADDDSDSDSDDDIEPQHKANREKSTLLTGGLKADFETPPSTSGKAHSSHSTPEDLLSGIDQKRNQTKSLVPHRSESLP
ncbi:hypothetical protein ACHAXH_002645 [Discostella pseudostelligera]